MSVLEDVLARTSWDVRPFGRLTNRSKEAGRPDLEPLSVFLDAGVVPRAEREDNYNRLGADMSNYLVVRPGDIVFNKLRTWQGGLGVSRHKGVVSPAYFVCRPQEAIDPRYYHYLLRSNVYLAELTRLSKFMPPSQFDIAWDDLRTLAVLHPPLAEQRAIADYLDAETVRIDALIAKKQQLIHLLEERRDDFVERRLFGGVRTTRLDRLTDPYRPIMYGIVLPGPDVGEGVPIVKGGNVRNHKLGGHVCHTTVDIERSYARARLASGDLVIIIRGAGAGRVAEVHVEHTDWNITQDVARVAPALGVDSRWLRHVLEGRQTQEQFRIRVGGAVITGINIWDLKRIEVPDVDLSEQTLAARDVGKAEARTAALTSALTSQAELLAEHRQALVTAAVIGDLSVAASV